MLPYSGKEDSVPPVPVTLLHKQGPEMWNCPHGGVET